MVEMRKPEELFPSQGADKHYYYYYVARGNELFWIGVGAGLVIIGIVIGVLVGLAMR